jgi:hypothetical protein
LRNEIHFSAIDVSKALPERLADKHKVWHIEVELDREIFVCQLRYVFSFVRLFEQNHVNLITHALQQNFALVVDDFSLLRSLHRANQRFKLAHHYVVVEHVLKFHDVLSFGVGRILGKSFQAFDQNLRIVESQTTKQQLANVQT